MSGSSTYPTLGVKIPDNRQSGTGEYLYTRGGAATRGDVRLINPFTGDAAVDSTKYAGTADAWSANATPVEVSLYVNSLNTGSFRLANANIADDALGPYVGSRRCLAIARVSSGSATTWSAGTELIAVDAQPYLALASTGAGGEKVIARLTHDQAVISSGANMLSVEFDGEHGFGVAPTADGG